MKVSQIFNTIYNEEFGYRPATGNLKPAHVANSFARNSIMKIYDTKNIQKIIRPQDTKKRGFIPYDDRKYETLVEGSMGENNILSQFEDYRGGHKKEFEDLRGFFAGIFNADDAFYAFKKSNMLCASFSNQYMITTAEQSHGLGDFCAQLLKNTNLEKMFKTKLEEKEYIDPISKLFSPLKGEFLDFVPKDLSFIINKQHNKEIIKIFNEISENLYLHEKNTNSLRTIRRIVQFISLLPIFHVQALASNGVLKERPLIVLTSDIHSDSIISKLSSESIHNVYYKLHDWLKKKLMKKLNNQEPLTDEPDSIFPMDEKIIKDALTDEKILLIGSEQTRSEIKQNIINNRLNIYDQHKKNPNSNDYGELLASVLNTIFLNESDWFPKVYYRQLARKIGFFYPYYREQEKTIRVYPTTLIKDLLTRLMIKPDEGLIPLSDFLSRLRNKLGIIVGDVDDHKILKEHSLSVDMETLEKNKNSFVDDLEKMGLAKKYADNETLIGFENV